MERRVHRRQLPRGEVHRRQQPRSEERVAYPTYLDLRDGNPGVLALLFGLAPAVHASRSDALPVLESQSATSSPGRSGSRFRRALVASQVALSLLLLTAAGLFARNLHALFAVDPGFETSRLLSFTIDPSQHRYTPERSHQLALEVQRRLRQIPGVAMASGAAFPVAPAPSLAEHHQRRRVRAGTARGHAGYSIRTLLSPEPRREG